MTHRSRSIGRGVVDFNGNTFTPHLGEAAQQLRGKGISPLLASSSNRDEAAASILDASDFCVTIGNFRWRRAR